MKAKGGGGLCFLSKVIESKVVEGERLGVSIKQVDAGQLASRQCAYRANAPEGQVELRGQCGERRAVLWRCGEGQLVVVAACELATLGQLRVDTSWQMR